MRPFLAAALALALAALLALPALAAEPVGVLVAVDGSRSLSPAESQRAREAAALLLDGLPAGAPSGALAFADEVRWLARLGEPGGAAALAELRPGGNLTVLHDSLVQGARALPDGGVLVLFTDGRDEGSATTLEDAATLAAGNRVRVVAVGAGRADERTLRRLALLTGGAWAGRLRDLDPGRLAGEVETLRGALAAERRAAEARIAPPPTPAPTPDPTPAPPPTASGPGAVFLALALLLTAAAALVGYLLARRRAAPAVAPEIVAGPVAEQAACPRCDHPLPAPGAPCPHCRDLDLIASLRAKAAVPPGQLLEISLEDTNTFARIPFSEAVEKTFVMAEETVLVVREPGRESRTLRLPPDRAISVGRDRQRNTLAFADPTLSSQHFRLAAEGGAYYLLDLQSTNGLFLHEERVQQLARLRPGDTFRAGQLEFELQVRQQSLT